jgi:hypothetical protein
MKTKYLIAVLLGTAAAVAGINCAPVDPAASTEAKSDEPRPRVPQGPPPAAAVPPFEAIRPPVPPVAAPPDAIKQRIDLAIAQVRGRQLRTDNGFWTVFHGILGLGPSVTLEEPLTGRKVNALDYIASGGKVPGLHFVPTGDGLDVETGPGTFEKQGHQDQFIAEMVEWNVAPERKFKVDGKDHTFGDFLRFSKARASVKMNQELEWALVIIGSHYGTDAEWTNAFGEKVRFEDLVRAELDKDLDKASCGGTHLLFGLTWAYHLHQKNGGEPVGVWKEVADRIAAYKRKAREVQNADGTFSTDFFTGRAGVPDVNRRINTTGHVLEWLALAMTDEELKEPWVQGAANALAMLFLENDRTPLEGGGMYHAVHGLLIYTSRVYGADKLGDLKPHVPPPPPAPKKA